MVCPECGGGNAPDADRCGHCGADLTLARPPVALFTPRRAGGRRGSGGLSLVLGAVLILPLALAGYVEASSDLRLQPVPLLVAVLLAAAGFELVLRAAGRHPETSALGGSRSRRRGRPREPYAAGGG